jgi:ferredoxin-thioredoxin reductase catalytic subunit
MIENLAYVVMGFAATYLSLEVAWHFTACRLKDDSSEKKREIMKPCMFKEIKMVLVAPHQASPGRVRQ